jgi:hypothetical protein
MADTPSAADDLRGGSAHTLPHLTDPAGLITGRSSGTAEKLPMAKAVYVRPVTRAYCLRVTFPTGQSETARYETALVRRIARIALEAAGCEIGLAWDEEAHP